MKLTKLVRNAADQTTFITSLPDQTNDGLSTNIWQWELFTSVWAAGGRVAFERGGFGMWYDDGKLYAESVTAVRIIGLDESIVKRILAKFGRDAGQLAMLCVQVKADGSHIAGLDKGREGAARLALQHGGATLLGDEACSLVYSGLEQGVDY